MTSSPVADTTGTGPLDTPKFTVATWSLRAVAFVVVTVIALQGHTDHRGVVVAVLAVAGVLLTGWAFMDRASRRGHALPTWSLMVVLSGLGAAAGIVSALPAADSVVALALVAAISAGSELDTVPACAVGAIIILAIEVSTLAFGFDNGAIGWPLAVVAALLGGRSRRDARTLSAQATALMAQVDRTRTEEQRAATLDERARIAREIHDLLAHSLGVLGIQIEAVQALLVDAGDIDRAVPLLDQAHRLAADGLEETRRAIEALRTDTPPLPESLASLAEGHLQQSHAPVEVSVAGTPRPLSPDANLALIRVAHEALTNAAKHAAGASVSIALDYGPERTTMTITTTPGSAPEGRLDPTGTVPGASGGYGLAGMRERLLLIGGTLTAGPGGGGWVVQAGIPL